jgi:hypothetical protein
MYDQIYTYPDPNKESGEQKEEQMEFGFKDILAMVIAAYQVVFFPLITIMLSMVIIYFLFKLFFRG